MGSEARTRLGLAGLLAVTWLSFNQLFDAGDYPGPILLGMLLATGLALATRRLGIGSVATLALSAAGLLWYVAFVFQTHLTLFGLPTPSALAALMRSIARAYSFSQVDFAPVPVRVGYVILVVAGMWGAAALAELATFRWRRPLLATLPSIALFSTTMIFGTGAGAPVLMVLFLAALLTFWGFEASHRVRSWGRWVSAWPGRGNDEPESITGSMARRMGASCIVVALAAPLFLPTLGDGLLSWRTALGEGLGAGGGGGGGGRIDPLVSIAPSLVNQSDQILFRVTSNRSSYWRLVALPNFDGRTWSPADEATTELDGGFLEGDWLPDADHTRIEHEVTLAGLRGEYLPAAVQARAVDVLDGPGDVAFQPQTGDLRVEDAGDGFTYRVISVAPRPGFEELVDASPGSTDPVFSQMPDLSPDVERLRDRWIVGETTAYGKLVAIQNALRTGDYSYRLPSPEDLTAEQKGSTDQLERFLLDTQTGYCQQFSIAFAALSRSLGYPTRVVVGFLPGESPTEGQYVVRGIDAHSWPEVFFERYGWVRFEPTPRADNGRITSAPGYTAPDFVARGPLGNDGGAVGSVAANVEDPQAALDARALNDQNRDGASSAIGLQERAGQGAGAANPGLGGDEDARWEQTFRRLALVLTLVLVGGLAAVPALKARRIRRVYRGATTPGAVAAAAFHEFMLEAGELAAPRGPAESARAYVRRVARLKGLPEPSALRLASLYERAEYAPSQPSSSEGGEARTLARQMRAGLWENASWWERVARLFSPAGLVSDLQRRA